MRKVCFLLCLFSLNLVSGQSQFMLGREPELMVNNRILANINGKPISVVDVMKKMDVIFYRQYPEYRDSIPARAQFYQSGWKDTLQQLIDKELIAADAQEGRLEVSNGDIRQEMETMFGPNIIANLDRIGLSYEDAWEIIKDEIIIRRMLYFRVNSKAIKKISPQVIHEAYEKYAKENLRETMWRYRVISVQDKNERNSEQVAYRVHQLLTQEKVPFDEVKSMLEKLEFLGETTKLNISDEYSVKESEISDTHKTVLSTIQSGSFSEPIMQKSRTGSKFWRVFFLNEMVESGYIPFQEVENQIIGQLTEEAVGKETEQYLKRLRRHFHTDIDDIRELALNNDFQPFVIK